MNIIFFLVSLLLFAFAPDQYNFIFCAVVTGLFLLQTVPFSIKKSNGNYVNFYTVFFFAFFFTNFFYPVFLYPIDPEFFSTFTLPFNEDLISKGTALAYLVSSSFILGTSHIKTRNINSNENTSLEYYYRHNILTITTLLLFAVFFSTVGRDFLSGDFTAHSSFSLYVLRILTCFFILSSIIYYKYYKYQNFRSLYYLTAFSYIILFLSIGDRGPGLYLIILMTGLYTFYVKLIPFKYILTFALFGVLLMHIIGQGRTTNINTAEGNIIQRGIEQIQYSPESSIYLEATRGFVVNNRNLYVGIEYVEDHGVNWGETMAGSFLGIIPFAQSTLESLSNFRILSSSQFFTELTFGQNPPYGLGTNLIADVYISFGLIGSIILFFLFGRVVEVFRIKSINTNSHYSIIVYFTLLNYSIYYPRTMLFMPLNFIIWSIIIFYLIKQFKILKKINI